MLNKMQAIGRLTRDPETRYTNSGKAITNFCLALTESWKGDDGEWRENTTFTEWNCWNGSGENLAKLTKKGDLVYAEGKFTLDTWEDKESGEKRSTPRFTASFWKLLAKKGAGKAVEEGETEEKSEPTKSKKTRTTKSEKKEKVETPAEEDDGEDSEIPF